MLGSFFRISESSVTHLRSSRFSMASAKHQFCIFHLLEWLGYLEKSFRFLHEGIPPRQFSSHLSAYRNILVILSRNLSSAARFFCAHFCVMNIVRQNDSTQPSLITLKRHLVIAKIVHKMHGICLARGVQSMGHSPTSQKGLFCA